MTTKSQLRKKALQERQELSDTEFQKRNNSLIVQLQAFVSKEDFQTIHTFLPIAKNREPDVTSLFANWWKEGRKIMVSRTDFESKEMKHFWLTESTKLLENAMGIPEPVDAKSADFSEAQLVIVPLLLADTHGNRVGYGGGYYDRLLQGYDGKSVGLSLAPLADAIPKEDWDVNVTSILYFSSKP